MQKKILVIILMIITVTNISSVYSQETIDELLKLAKAESSLGTEQNFYNAIKYYEKVLEIEPENTSALNGKAAMLILLEKMDDAETYVDKALEIDPENVSALSNKAIILQYNDKKELALETLERAIAIQPNNTDILFNKANILKLLDVDKSIDTLDQIILIDPTNEKAIAQKQNLFDNMKEVRVDGYIQMALRDKSGSLIGYTESDVLQIRNSTFAEFYLFNNARKINNIEINGEKFFNIIMGGSLPMTDDITPSKSGVRVNMEISHGNLTKIVFSPVTARTHGYMTVDGDILEEITQIIIPQRNFAK